MKKIMNLTEDEVEEILNHSINYYSVALRMHFLAYLINGDKFSDIEKFIVLMTELSKKLIREFEQDVIFENINGETCLSFGEESSRLVESMMKNYIFKKQLDKNDD